MMNKPLVSVIMPVYNSELYLKEAIESIVNQTYENFELIIIDDGSSDNSVSIVKSINSEKIKLVINEKNLGVSATRNKGLNLAKGEYIALMDSDDISLPKRLEIQVNFLETNLDYGLISSYYESFRVGFFGIKKRVRKLPLNDKQIKVNLLFFNVICCPSAMIRKNVIIKNNLFFDEKLRMSEDFDLWKKISKVSKIANIGEVLLRYRKHPNNTIKNRINLDKSFLIVAQRTFDDFDMNILKLFDEKFKLKDISNFIFITKYLENILEKNQTEKEYDSVYLEESCSVFIYWVYKKNFSNLGYGLFKELIKMRWFKYDNLTFMENICLSVIKLVK